MCLSAHEARKRNKDGRGDKIGLGKNLQFSPDATQLRRDGNGPDQAGAIRKGGRTFAPLRINFCRALPFSGCRQFPWFALMNPCFS